MKKSGTRLSFTDMKLGSQRLTDPIIFEEMQSQ